MSSHEDEHDEEIQSTAPQGTKKRRVQRACDICRRKKVRCDGGQMPNNRCTNCITYNNECTYIEAAKKRGPPKGYVEGLESRVVKMEKLLLKLCPDDNLLEELGGPFDKEAWLAKGPRAASHSTTSEPNRTHAIPPPMHAVDDDDLDPSDNEMTARHTLERNMKNLSINAGHPRFFGKSSSVMFLQTAIALRKEYTGQSTMRTDAEGKRNLLPCKRPEFWRAHPWIIEALEHDKPHTDFPPEDLMPLLIDLYFDNCNLYIPLLHRPTFENGIAEGLHLKDEGFGSTVLLVCALGARFCDNPRVILEGTQSGHSAGWEWFRQVQWVRRSLLAPPRLYDLQISCLTAMFLHGSSTPQASWIVLGVGIRLAQDVGAHRRKTYNMKKTIEEELWKRAFWCLLCLDRFVSSALGRTCAIHDEDFDLELPADCDDEYWINDDPSLAFKQPAGKPSKVTYFISLIKLNQILAFALRTVYSINKSKVLLGFVGPRWEQHIVAELDSALNKWVDAIPNHLRWDPKMEDSAFLAQSAALYASYYSLQIIVHRPFISSPRKPSSLLFPSLAICTNAARSCIHVLDVQFQRGGRPSFTNMMALFSAGIVLLLCIWGGKRTGANTDPSKEMVDVHKAMKMLKSLEPRWHTAGKVWDIMFDLASVGDLPLPQASPTPSHKRDRDSDGSSSASPSSSSAAASPATDEPRHIAGSRRVSEHQQHLYDRNPSVPRPEFNQAQPPQELFVPPAAIGSDANKSTDFVPTMTPPAHTTPGLHSAASASPSVQAPYGQTLLPTQTSFQHYAQAQLYPNYAGMANINMPTRPQAPPGQPLDMAPMFSMQSIMYDQVLSNLSASLMQPSDTSIPAMTGYPRVTTQPGPLSTVDPQLFAPPDDFAQMLASLDAEAAAYVSGFPSDNSMSVWSTPPDNFEWDDWGSYISSFGGAYPQSQPNQTNGYGQGGSGP